jgi:lysophospholipase L1-like esterase
MLDETLRRSSCAGLRSACAQHGWMHPKARLAIALLLSLVLAPVSLLPQALVVEKVTAPTKLTPISVHSFGRTKLDADGMYTFRWPGVYFTFAYQAPALYFRVGQGRQNLHIFVDSQTRDIVTDGHPAVYRISAPADQTHVVRIDVVNENPSAAESLGGFAVSVGGKGIESAINSRQIEFIGDSHTVGYGNTSTSRECTADQVWATTNTAQSIASDTALHYGANYQINAISGRGVVRNYDGVAADPVPVAYRYLLLDKQENYEDSAWKPQVIAISLGTNDFATALHPTEPWKTREDLHAAYESTYANFILQLRLRNPTALIILWSSDEEEIASEEKKIVQTLRNSGDSRIDFVEVSGLAFEACLSHPSIADDRLVSRKLIETIDSYKNIWPDSNSESVK